MRAHQYLFLVVIGCGGNHATNSDGGTGSDAGPAAAPTITATVNSTRFVTREHLLAAGEMQISGEPFAEAMGRDLSNYSRDHLPTDIYFDTSPDAAGPWIDLAGFSTGVESYEYSKQPMNGLGFEYGAGTSLVYGPLVNAGPSPASGSAATAKLAGMMQHYATASNALGRFVFAPNTYPANNASGNINPTGAGSAAANPMGWPGIWPTNHVYADFDPTMDPTSGIDLACAITSDDDPGASGALGCADYECDASSLHLRDRASQIDFTITPGADGFSAWKYGLWTLNYLQVMHDSTEAGVAYLDTPSQLSQVGSAGNTIVGDDGTGSATAAGTFLGSSDIEGFQAQLFLEMLDNRAQDWLASLTTTNGTSLAGFPSIMAADSYGYASPLQWFPGKIAVTESADADSGFPKPSYALASPNSDLMDLVGIAMGFAEIYSLTDDANIDVGGSQPAEAYFDGDPFPTDDGSADGEPTLHDRALGMVRVALVNLDRLHTDPASGLLVDDVTMTGTTPARGTTIATTSIAYTLLGLRTVLRSCSSQLELYSNNTPDTAVGITPLDLLPIAYPSDGTLTFTGRMSQLLQAEAGLLYNQLTDSTGKAYVGWDVSASAPTTMDDTLDAHTAAIRGLFAAYLATGDVKYETRAIAVFDRMQSVFYDPAARIWGTTPAPVTDVEMTPLRFALLQSSLRDMYELVAVRPGGESREPVLEDLVARANKLFLNGWDDRNGNRLVEWPDECVSFDGTLPHGGLQMAERTLTGEIGSLQEQLMPGMSRTATSDREQDCVPEIDDAHLPSALADSVTFHVGAH
jgi:hypothetical protein